MRPYPYHRYLTYRLVNGDTADEVIDHLHGLRYIPPTPGDVEELMGLHSRRVMTPDLRKRLGIGIFDSKSMAPVYWLVETPGVRTAAERLLLDGVQPRHVATILSAKFDNRMTTSVVEMFRDGFWDTLALSRGDFSNYFHLGNLRFPEPPPESVSLATRSNYTAWKDGVYAGDDELGPDAIVREIQVDAFMRYKESVDRNDPKTAMEWAKLALKTAPARRSIAESKVGTKIPDIKMILEYPNERVPTIGELHTDYSQETAGTGSVSAAMGRREDDR